MSWNYRVMRIKNKDKTYDYGIFEVYYKEDKIEGWTENSACIYGSSLQELKKTLKLMNESFKKPVLDYNTGKEIEIKT